MNRTEAKEAAKPRLEEYLNIITTKKGNQYDCPLCGSGTGKNKTPAGQLNSDYTFHCFSCNFHGDIFTLVGAVEGITNQADKFNRTYEILNIQVNRSRQLNTLRSDESTSAEQNSADYSKYYKICHARAGETDYFSFRGLSKTTIDRFNLGFDPAWQSPKALRDGRNPPVSQRIIIPTSNYSYVARSTDKTADPKFKIVKEGRAELFNSEALHGTKPIFIVEGELDALSVIEVGFEALALGSTSNKTKFIELCKAQPPESVIILSLDNDDAGRKTQAEIADALKRSKITFLEANINSEYKDPNEALQANRAQFKRILEDTVSYASQYALEAEEIKKVEAEAEQRKYISEASVTAQLNDFMGEITSTVDTPVISTGFAEFDKILDGGLYEGLYVLGAISSLGKTSFILQIADQMAQQGQDVLIFTLEMAKTELMAKSISRLTFLECGGNAKNAKTTRGITSNKRYAGYSDEEKALISSSVKKYGEYTDRLFIYEGLGDVGTAQIRELTETHIKSTGNKPVIIIDYLQILAPHEPRATDKQNTDKSVFELKRISRHYKIPILAISSLNRENYSSAISMAAYKESGAVEYSSDVLLGLQLMGAGQPGFDVNAEKKKNPRKIELKILKNRNGATGDSIMYDYFTLFNYFRETGEKVADDTVKKGSKHN